MRRKRWSIKDSLKSVFWYVDISLKLFELSVVFNISELDWSTNIGTYSEGDQPWVFFGGNDTKAEAPVLWPPHTKSWLIGKEELTHWKRPWCWEGLGAGGEGDDRGWDGWMATTTRWTRVWVNSGRWWWTGRPGVLQFMGSQRGGHEWVTELNRTDVLESYFLLQGIDRVKHNDYYNEIEGMNLFSGCFK